jgi:hypothetical protein
MTSFFGMRFFDKKHNSRGIGLIILNGRSNSQLIYKRIKVVLNISSIYCLTHQGSLSAPRFGL